MRIRNLALCVGILAITACEEAKPERSIPSSNATLGVEVMGTFDGCTLYRVNGMADRVYVTRCGQDRVDTLAAHTHCDQIGDTTSCYDRRVNGLTIAEVE